MIKSKKKNYCFVEFLQALAFYMNCMYIKESFILVHLTELFWKTTITY